MPKRPLPTGEEPPRGFESIVSATGADDALRVNCVFVSQLAKVELSEINRLRDAAFSNVIKMTGLADRLLSIEEETGLLPGKDASDKLLFRAYKNRTLVGYALVVIGWPQNGDWVIQHLVINPNYRLQGIGSSIVHKIENFAMRSEVDSNRVFAIPLEEKGTIFWQDHGYKVESSRQLIRIEGLDHELVAYHKELVEA